jgi:putative ABC transport system permease protein
MRHAQEGGMVFKNYLKITLRNLIKYKIHSFIKILGLAIGMACTILIFLWIRNELSFNKFHEHGNNIYQVPTRQQYGSEIFIGSGAPSALGPALMKDYPEIINSARIRNGKYELLVQYGEKRFMEKVQIADMSLFDMFTFPFVKGSHKYAFSDPHVVVMTEEMAIKYFDNGEPIGQILTFDNQYDFRIIGILKNIPQNSTLQFDFLVPLEFLREWRGENIYQWSDCSYITFVQLQKYISFEEINQKITGRIKRENKNSNIEPFLYPFNRVYLYSMSGHGGRIVEVRIFMLVAFLILFIACINFMNLSTATSAKRAAEVGLRKVLGADRGQLIKQFFSESIALSFIALIFALFLVELFLPSFRTMTGKPLAIAYLGDITVLGVITGIACFTGILSGSYPALFLSAFQPVKTITGFINKNLRGTALRRLLVVAQFAISIILIIGTIVIFNQLHYIKNKDLGFRKDQLIYIPVNGNLEKDFALMKKELLKNTGILNIAMSSHLPTGIYSNGSGWNWEGKRDDVDPMVTELVVDGDFLETFQMKMVQGRFFLQEFSRNSLNVVINERFADIMELESPVGRRLMLDPYTFNIIGIIKDFNFKPLNINIEPIIISNNPEFNRFKYMFIKISSKNIPRTITLLEKEYQKFNPGFPFEFHFLDDDYDQLYWAQQQMDQIIRYFSFLAIFISGIGLFGLASFTAEQRTKEIGVRKILGGSVSGIIILLIREFTKWVFLANLIAWPIAYFAMNKWLQNFAYRIDLTVWPFLLAGFLALVIALLIVSWQAVRAATANPIDSLRYE